MVFVWDDVSSVRIHRRESSPDRPGLRANFMERNKKKRKDRKDANPSDVLREQKGEKEEEVYDLKNRKGP